MASLAGLDDSILDCTRGTGAHFKIAARRENVLHRFKRAAAACKLNSCESDT